MSMQKRTPYNKKASARIGTGPYLARIVNHLDPSFMGSLEVTLLREQGNVIGEDQQTFVVKCAMPFFGYTGFEFMGQNTASRENVSTLDAYNDTQKSYGMWFVPPDVGVTVLVVFVDGDPSQGYWIGCVPSNFSNHMVPAIAGSKSVDLDAEDKRKYGTSQPLPVAEINRRLNAREENLPDPERIKKPVHPIADRFLEQGLLEDDVRGTTNSTARRETPSMVFGISTPGPRDKRPGAKKAQIGTRRSQTPNAVPVSRLGGTQFVMDDGDERYVRATPAKDGPVKYIDLINGTDLGSGQKTNEKGDPTIPYNEYFRVRTRTGHQILMHNSEDLIYIGNSRGTTWIELTSNGKIDIYAQDSVSIHTENDFNFKAGRDFNFEAGRNINMKTETGRWRVEVATNLEFLVNENANITVGADNNLLVGGNTRISTGANFNVSTNGDNRLTATGDTNIGSGGDHIESAASINMNSTKTAEAAEVSPIVKPLNLHPNPASSKTSGWENRYRSGSVDSIMKRVPMHEPWPLHENQAPGQLGPDGTDREQ
jgi:phage baseplate assembly protein gpV